MQKRALAGLTLVGLLALVFSFSTTVPSRPAADAAIAADSCHNATIVAHREVPSVVTAASDFAPPAEAAPPPPAEEKAARLGRIQRDYDDVRLDLMHRYGSEGETFPGGADALLRQFALLEREKHADLARVLTARELEDLESRETAAGRRVQRMLASSTASGEQRRAVFRLERRFELQHGHPTEATPAAVAERAVARRATDDQIRAVLGDVLYVTWLAGPAGALAD